jgi:hypothetical protein
MTIGPRTGFARRLAKGAVCGATLLVLSGSAVYAQSAPFAGMAGVWSGTGTIELDDGSKERIRCRATYAVSGDGNGLNQSLTCASDSYKFALKSDVIARDGVLSGTWREESRNVSGSLEGRAGNGHFSVVVSAPAFTANVSLTTRGNRQTVSIASQGQIKGATISLSRS